MLHGRHPSSGVKGQGSLVTAETFADQSSTGTEGSCPSPIPMSTHTFTHRFMETLFPLVTAGDHQPVKILTCRFQHHRDSEQMCEDLGTGDEEQLLPEPRRSKRERRAPDRCSLIAPRFGSSGCRQCLIGFHIQHFGGYAFQ